MGVTIKQRKKLISELNPQQKDAVRKTLLVPSLVIAGAGSGKTKVLTTRIAYILSKYDDPGSILAVTFTNKAATEMRERVASVVGEADAKSITIGTFHSLCVRWLHKYYAEAGLRKGWTILDDDDTTKMIKNILKDMNLPTEKEAVRMYKGVISTLKNDMIGPQDYRNKIQYAHERTILKVYQEYMDRLTKQNVVDFDDLLFRMVRVLENFAKVRRRFQRRFEWVKVDEYQDTNEAQYRLVKLIVGKHNNLFIVGDDYQSIYGWRGANIQKILNFQNDYPNAQVLKLEQNYRSTQTIVEAGNKIMENAPNQMQKTCFSQNPVGDPISVHQARYDKDEAAFVAEEIMNLVTFEGYKYSEIAVLYRTNVLSRLFEERFMTMSIPYNMVSGFSFYERREIKETLGWLQMSVNPDNDTACERILTTMPGLGKTTIDNLIEAQKRSSSLSLYQVVERFNPKMVKTRAALATLVATVDKTSNLYALGAHLSDKPISDMLEIVLETTGLAKRYEESNKAEDHDRAENIKELVKMAKGYEEETNKPNLQDFLDQIALTAQSDKISKKAAEKVQMMTLHTSKGLEYRAVFFVGFEQGLMPHAGAKTPDTIAEERRLAYVGVTRAKERLYLSSVQARMNWSRQWESKTPSEFLDLIPHSLRQDV